MMQRMRRTRRILCVLLALLPCGGCVWLENEFAVYDVKAPATAEPLVLPASTAPW